MSSVVEGQQVQEELFGVPLNWGLPVSFTNIFNMFAPIGTGGAPSAITDPVSTFNYLHNKADFIAQSARQRPWVRLADKNLSIVGDLTGEISMEFEELMVDSGTAKYIIRLTNWLADYIVNLTGIQEDLHLVIDPIPSQSNWISRWGGKIHTINVKKNTDGTQTLELLAISNREHSKRLLFAAAPYFPPEFQLPKMWILPGPIRSVMFLSCFINLARLFVPGLSFLTNIFNPLSWLDPLNVDAVFQLNPLDWPIQVAFVNTLLDSSMWTVLGATWTDWDSTSKDLLKYTGTMMRAYTYLVDDDKNNPTPYNELADLFNATTDLTGFIDPTVANAMVAIGDDIARPTRNCIIFRFEDKSGYTGPTGTALDGLLSVIGVTLDDLFTSVLINTNTGLTLGGEPVYNSEGENVPLVESLLGVAPTVPVVIWRDGQFTGVIEATHTVHKGTPRRYMTGGRSPALVNELQTFAIRYSLAQISDMINVAIGTWVNTAFQMPATPGLDNLYQGQLDNVLLAWEAITAPVQAVWGGALDFQEFFERGSSTAYTLSGVLTIQQAMWKNRAYHGFKARVRNGIPWTIFLDTGLGDRNGFEFDAVPDDPSTGIIFVDQIYGIKGSVDRKKALLYELTIGEDQGTYNPMMAAMKSIQSVYQMFGAFLGEGILFG